ncbi:MAG: Two component regulator three Y domain-containing protein [Maribacter sp.]|uniref:helix-turn-helix and ligand-binding sensor domain-containing protein n=1 Tax=Maribacter sp. TaxID=1897614 RepID=UPI003296F253
MKILLLSLLALFNVSYWAIAQDLSPPIQNYSGYEYNAASKNWGLTVDPDGELYVANNDGLLHFNGEKWNLNKLPNKTILRSVSYIKGKIYTGSYEEFGYWEKDKYGSLQYNSLTHLIKEHEFTSEEFWQILQFGDTIIFRSFSNIYVYREDEVEVIDAPFVVTNIAVYNNEVIVAGEHRRLFWLRNGSLVPLEHQDDLIGKIIVDMVQVGNHLLIGTKLSGCFLLKDGKLEVLENEINDELKEHQLNKFLTVKDNKIVFGTIKNGIYIYDLHLQKFQNFNRELGLQNNTILAMLQFKEQLWLGLDNGIDKIQLNNPITYYTDYSGALGTVYDLIDHDDTLYLGSNTGVYYFQDNNLQFVPGSQGHVWDLELLDGELFCGHNTGTFILSNKTLIKVSNISGGYQIIKIPEKASTFLQGTYTGMAKFEKDEQGVWSTQRIEGIDSPVKQLCFENAFTIWAAHPYKGLFRIKMDENHTRVIDKEEVETNVIPNPYNIKLYNIKNQIVLSSEGAWYKYDPILDEIIPFEEFKNYSNMDLVHFNDRYYWFLDNENSKKIIRTNLKQDFFTLDDVQLRKRLALETKTIINYNDSIYYFTLSDGFGKLNLTKLQSQLNVDVLPQPRLSSFADEEKMYALDESIFHIPYNKSQSLTIDVSAGSFKQYKYYYELQGAIEQSTYQDNGTISFQNLTFGSYALYIHTVSIGNELSEVKKIEFKIMPPWYLSKWSMLLYLLLFMGVIILIRLYNKTKLERKHKRLKEKLQREQEERLANLEKEKLSQEIKSKQKELTSTTMNVAKKNELILELKALLLMNKDKFENKQRYRSFIRKLDSSINDDADWKHFEVNFKELHEDFFEILLHKYPKLTPKDLKLCAYLKMNLASKEIAPLMGISTRGVEIHRYRLRKKLQIEASQNISNFLITLR